jgi:mannose-6-phosphate isomerase-like protein (cupin superfamily)
MNRNSFLTGCLAVGGFLSSPFAALAKVNRKGRVDKAFKVDAGKDRFNAPISLLEGDMFYTKISSKDTDNDLYVFESTRLKNGGPREHVHFDQDEWWYVLSGEFTVKIGDQIFYLKAGDSAFGPRMVPHVWEKTNEGEGKLLMIFQPAGKMEALFKAISEGIFKNKTEEEKEQIRQAHGLKSVGPALSYEKKG